MIRWHGSLRMLSTARFEHAHKGQNKFLYGCVCRRYLAKSMSLRVEEWDHIVKLTEEKQARKRADKFMAFKRRTEQQLHGKCERPVSLSSAVADLSSLYAQSGQTMTAEVEKDVGSLMSAFQFYLSKRLGKAASTIDLLLAVCDIKLVVYKYAVIADGKKFRKRLLHDPDVLVALPGEAVCADGSWPTKLESTLSIKAWPSLFGCKLEHSYDDVHLEFLHQDYELKKRAPGAELKGVNWARAVLFFEVDSVTLKNPEQIQAPAGWQARVQNVLHHFDKPTVATLLMDTFAGKKFVLGRMFEQLDPSLPADRAKIPDRSRPCLFVEKDGEEVLFGKSRYMQWSTGQAMISHLSDVRDKAMMMPDAKPGEIAESFWVNHWIK
eukprot:GDKI01044909.1.p1 GENE.GDKI01044909.1~~GDKI01044909.1.p1  ORF type:complete len:380 (+),score=55.51 GDKI01044909.1:970-2109(+)